MKSMQPMMMHVVPLLLLISPILAAPKCSNMDRDNQVFPGYLNRLQAGTISAFEEHIKKHAVTVNKTIPPVCAEATRVVLYSVNRLLDAHNGRDAVEKIKRDISSLNPSVVVLAQLPPETDPKRKQLITALTDLKLITLVPSKGHDTMLAAARIPITHVDVPGAEVKSLGLAVNVANKVIHLAAISLSPVTITDGSPFHDEHLPTSLIILDGPMTKAKITSPSGEIDKAYNIFSLLEAPLPDFTSWTGQLLDYIQAQGSFRNRLCGAYLYYTEATGRLPVVADIGDCQYMDKMPMFVAMAATLVIWVGIAGHYYFKRYRRSVP